MSKIEQLIQELCPGGVKYSKLRDIGKVCMCKRIMKEQTSSSGDVPFYKIGTFGGNADAFISQDLFDTYKGKYSYPQKGDVLISAAGTIGRTIVFDGEPAYFQDSNIVWLKHDGSKVLNSYLRYCYSLNPWAVSTGGTVARLYNDNILNAIIPLPSLPIQQEIVRILDTFTEAQANLEQELELRKKQYEYYLDKLYGSNKDEIEKLGESDGISIMTLSDLGTLTRGKRFVRDDVKESGQPCIHYGDMYTYYGTKAYQARTFLDRDFPKKMRYAKPGDVVIVGAGENDTDIGVGLAWFGDEPAVVHDACYILEHNQNPMYISYYLRSGGYHQQIRKHVSDGKICSISADGIGKSIIAIPSKECQQEIVSILDKFESVIQTLEEELALRKKQYEYYREKLLTFN